MQVYYWDWNYDAALESGTAAVQEFKRLGRYYYWIGNSLTLLGRISFMKGNYSEALGILFQALEACKAYSAPLSIAEPLEMMGRTWAKMGRNPDAKGAYAEAMQYYRSSVPVNEDGLTRCQFLAKQTEDPAIMPTPWERAALVLLYQDFKSGFNSDLDSPI